MDISIFETLNNMATTLKQQGITDVKPMFLTSIGIITGDIKKISNEPIMPNSKQVDFSYTIKDNKDIALNLENVVLKPTSNMASSINYPQLILFTNQIIAFSLINPKNFENH